VVIDFIEMKDKNSEREVEKVLRAGLKNDRARTDIGACRPSGWSRSCASAWASSALSSNMEPCPCCQGRGLRRNLEWQALQP
jgi:ribonuclease E